MDQISTENLPRRWIHPPNVLSERGEEAWPLYDCNQHVRIKKVKKSNEAKYLGCLLNDNVEAKKEISRRIADTHVTWKNLAELWKNGNHELREKLIIWDAVIRTKLMYGIESLQLNKDQRDRLDVFQLKGIRQIMKIPTTWGQMQKGETPTWDTDRIFRLLNAKINAIEARKKPDGFFKKIKTIMICVLFDQKKSFSFLKKKEIEYFALIRTPG